MHNHPVSHSVPLSVVAAEIGTSADELAVRAGNAVIVDETTGLRSLPAERCRELISAHHAAVQAAREKASAERAAAAARPNPLRDRVRALQAAQANYDGDPSAPALARALAADPGSAFNRRSQILDEMYSGETVMHRFRRAER